MLLCWIIIMVYSFLFDIKMFYSFKHYAMTSFCISGSMLGTRVNSIVNLRNLIELILKALLVWRRNKQECNYWSMCSAIIIEVGVKVLDDAKYGDQAMSCWPLLTSINHDSFFFFLWVGNATKVLILFFLVFSAKGLVYSRWLLNPW